jgi:hypothetical protein
MSCVETPALAAAAVGVNFMVVFVRVLSPIAFRPASNRRRQYPLGYAARPGR